MLFNYTLPEAGILVLKIQILIMTTDCDIRKCKISKTWIELFNVCATSTMLAQTKLLCWTIGLIWLMFLKLEISSERHLGGGLKELWTKYLILFLKNSFNSEILTYLSGSIYYRQFFWEGFSQSFEVFFWKILTILGAFMSSNIDVGSKSSLLFIPKVLRSVSERAVSKLFPQS